MSLLSASGGDFQDTWHVGLISFSAQGLQGEVTRLSSATAYELESFASGLLSCYFEVQTPELSVLPPEVKVVGSTFHTDRTKRAFVMPDE